MKVELIVGEHQVDGTRLLIYVYIYYIYRCIIFLPYCVTSKRYLHPVPSYSFIVTMYWTKFCMNYTQIVVVL